MKILVIAGSFPKEDNRTLCSYALDQVRAIQDLGNEILVISPTVKLPKVFNLLTRIEKFKKINRYVNVPKEYTIDNVKVIPTQNIYAICSRLVYKYPKISYKLYRKCIDGEILERIKNFEADYIYAIGTLMEGHIAKKLGEKFGIKYSVIEHSITNIVKTSENYKLKCIYKTVAESADNIFLVSSAQKRVLEEKIGGRYNEKVVLNGFRMEKFDSVKKSNQHGLKLITVGFIGRRKGYFNLAKAICKVVKDGYDLTWTIIGEGHDETELKTEIKQLGIENKVRFLGRLPHDAVIQEISASDIFALTSYDEPFGIVYLEAMSVGIPIIGSMGEGIEDIVVDKENGCLVDAKDVDSIVCAIEFLIDNTELRESIGRAGKVTVKGMTWERNARETMKAII